MEISLEKFDEVMSALETGQLRVAEKVDGVWKRNHYLLGRAPYDLDFYLKCREKLTQG